MSQKKSKYEFAEQASLSQQLASRYPEFSEYAGCDPEKAKAIASLKVFVKHGLIEDSPELQLLMDLMIARNRADFATSERTNEITKMGLLMPKTIDVVELDEDDDEEE